MAFTRVWRINANVHFHVCHMMSVAPGSRPSSLCNLPPFTYIHFTLSYQTVFLANIQSYQRAKSIFVVLTLAICLFSCFAKLISQLHSCKWTPRTASLIKFFAFLKNVREFSLFCPRSSFFSKPLRYLLVSRSSNTNHENGMFTA